MFLSKYLESKVSHCECEQGCKIKKWNTYRISSLERLINSPSTGPAFSFLRRLPICQEKDACFWRQSIKRLRRCCPDPLIRKKVSFGRRNLFWLGKSSTWKGSVSHNSLETGGWLEIYTGYIDWKWNWNLSRGLLISPSDQLHTLKKDQLQGLLGLPPSLPTCPSWPRSIFN